MALKFTDMLAEVPVASHEQFVDLCFKHPDIPKRRWLSVGGSDIRQDLVERQNENEEHKLHCNCADLDILEFPGNVSTSDQVRSPQEVAPGADLMAQLACTTYPVSSNSFFEQGLSASFTPRVSGPALDKVEHAPGSTYMYPSRLDIDTMSAKSIDLSPAAEDASRPLGFSDESPWNTGLLSEWLQRPEQSKFIDPRCLELDASLDPLLDLAEPEAGRGWVDDEEESTSRNHILEVPAHGQANPRPTTSEQTIRQAALPIGIVLRATRDTLTPESRPWARPDGEASSCSLRSTRDLNKQFLCPYAGCGKGYHGDSGLWKHIRKKHEVNEKFRCRECQTEIDRRDSYRRHFEAVHRGLSPPPELQKHGRGPTRRRY
ncbi:hypothetical protein QBC43DRAFT_293347 [Cladorrhinum sp. PSN259]|nr:hypothetical protein QBC43DRAFT_293347 [Cladorrhinum sp. PSN259]